MAYFSSFLLGSLLGGSCWGALRSHIEGASELSLQRRKGCEPFIHSLHAENELACIAGLPGLWQKRDADWPRGPHLELVGKAASQAPPSPTESESAPAAGSAPVCAGQVREVQSKPLGLLP